jgi:hypothetical protein
MKEIITTRLASQTSLLFFFLLYPLVMEQFWGLTEHKLLVSVLWITAAILTGPFIGWVGTKSGNFFGGKDNFSKPQPAYSIPDGLAATGQNACAIMAYNELAKNHPEEILPHLRVMKIWIEKMNDVDAAIMAYNFAMKTIRGQKNRNEFVKNGKK